MNRLQFNPDGARLIATHDRYARVHRSTESQAFKVATAVEILDVQSGRQLDYVTRGACSPDGRRIASKSRGDVILRVIDDGSTRRLTGLKDRVANVTFSHDGSRLAAADMYSNVIVWDTASGDQISSWNVKPNEFDRFLFSPDGQTLAILTVSSTVQLWDVNVGQQVAWFREQEIERIAMSQPPAIHRFIGFNFDGSLFASASGDYKLTVWNLKTHQSSAFRSRFPIRSVLFDPTDSLRLILLVRTPFGSTAVQEWNPLARHESRFIHKPGADYHTVAISRDGLKIGSLVSTARDFQPPQLIKIWDLTTGAVEQTLEAPRRAFDLAFSPDGDQIAVTNGDRGILVFDLKSPEIRKTVDLLKERVVRVTYNQDGTRLLIAHSNAATIWDLTSNHEVIEFAARNCVCAAYNHDESLVATCGRGGELSIWNARNGEMSQRMFLQENGPNSPDSGSASNDLYTVAFNHDSTRVAACGNTGRVGVWDVSTGELRLDLGAHEGRAFTVAFSPDGQRLISMGDDRVIRVWDSANGQKVLTLHGHADRIFHAAFDRGGGRLVSTSADGTIRIWDGRPITDHIDERE